MEPKKQRIIGFTFVHLALKEPLREAISLFFFLFIACFGFLCLFVFFPFGVKEEGTDPQRSRILLRNKPVFAV
ncbi:hypothetical protein V6N13_093578 [Hibiscus sabdariffa]